MAKRFYRKGKDIYEAGTDRHIGPSEWGRDWSGKATEVEAPADPVDVSGRSLEGTMTMAMAPEERSLDLTPEETERTLPGGTGGVANLRSVLRSAALAARAETRPTVGQELATYAAGGVDLAGASSGVIGSALEAGTLGRAEVEQAVFSNITDILKEQETRQTEAAKRNAEFAAQMIQTVSADPALFTSLTGQDFEDLKNGVVSTDLMRRIGEAAQAPKQFSAIKEAGLPGSAMPDEYWDRQDSLMGVPKGTHKAIADIAAEEKRLKTLTDMAELEGKTLEQVKNLTDALGNIPAGEPIVIDGSTYYGLMGTGKIEVDSQGYGRVLTVNPNTGEMNIKNIGFVGKTQDGWQIQFDGSGLPWRFNTKTGEFLYAGPATGEAGTSGVDWASVVPSGDIGGQCGAFVRRMTGVHVGDTLASKRAVVDPSIGTEGNPIDVGDVVVTSEGGATGHIAIVEGMVEDPNGELVLKLMESNFNGDGRVTHGRQLKASSPVVQGFARGSLISELKIGSDTAAIGMGAAGSPAFTPKGAAAERIMVDGKPYEIVVENGEKVAKPITVIGATGEEEVKKLSAADAKVLAITSTLKEDIGKLKGAFEKDYQGTLGGILTGTDRTNYKLAFDIADKVLRLRTGATAPDTEVKRFMKQIFSLGDLAFGDFKSANANLDRFITEAESITASITGVATSSDLRGQVEAKGYDYDKMKAAGWTDEKIKEELGL